MKKIALILIYFGLAITCAFGQEEASNWYFGENAGIRFNPDGTVSPLSSGKLNTIEGCATISDTNGNLLFYTDGISVWNKNHDRMPNGFGLYGDPSSTQSAIIVPQPEAPNMYYIFTVDTQIHQNDPDFGFNYSIVDMSLENGLGDVTIKNHNLLPTTSEKVTAVVKDCQTQSIWVITLAQGESGFFDTFYAYEVNTSGLNTVPVTSSFSNNITNRRGYLKLSPNGSKLVCANTTSGLFIYDFDKTTGNISNEQEITITFSLNGQKPQVAYGVEFSQNNQLLYVSSFYQTNEQEGSAPSAQYGALLQYNITATNISNTEYVIDNRQMYRGALQLGPDGKIYQSMNLSYDQGQPFLSTINTPNISGLGCNYAYNSLQLGSNGRQGLPPFITSFFSEKIDIIGNNSSSSELFLCENDTYTLTSPDIQGATYNWFKNGIPITNTTYFLDVDEEGLYKVFIDPNTGDCSQTLEGLAKVTYFASPVTNNHTLTQCAPSPNLSGTTTFNLTEAYEAILPTYNQDYSISFHKTENDAQNGVNAITNPESYENTVPNEILYTRTVHNFSGCFDTATLKLQIATTEVPVYRAPQKCDEVGSPDGINLFNLEDYKSDIAAQLNTTLNDVSITFYETQEDALIEANSLSQYRNKTPYTQSLYYRVETLNNNACFGINEIILSIAELPQIEKNENVLYCLNHFPAPIKINVGFLVGSRNNYSYLWSTGETAYEIDINEIGTYTVEITNQAGCSDQRTVVVEPSNIATIENVEVTDASTNNTINIMVSGEGIYEYALLDINNQIIRPYQTTTLFDNLFPGLYSIQIRDTKNDCGTITEPVSVIGFPKYFTPNNDGVNDTWQVYGVSEIFQPNTKIQIYNRYGKLIKELDPLGEGWNGSIRGEPLPNDDYWFVVKLQDGRVFKNHFTLKH
ncbi:T9SS type B sorting domain-containing protein [Tamlana crocina]